MGTPEFEPPVPEPPAEPPAEPDFSTLPYAEPPAPDRPTLKPYSQEKKRRFRAVQLATDPLASAAVEALEKAVGGREPLVAALLHAPPSTDLSIAIGAIADPRNDARALSVICADAGVTVGTLIEAYKRGVLARAQVGAIHAVAEALPAVIEDAVTRAAPHYLTCYVCDGTGTVVPEPTKKNPNPGPEPCRTCRGRGQTYHLPDLDRQKFAAELGGLITKGSAPLVDLSDRRSVSLSVGQPGGFASLIGAVDEVLHGQSRGGAPSATLGATLGDPPVEGEILESHLETPTPTETPAPLAGAPDATVAPHAPWGPPPGRRPRTQSR